MKEKMKKLVRAFTPLKKPLFANAKKRGVVFLTGFTLVEVVVALGVFTVGVLAIEAYFATSSRLTIAASRMSTASNLAQGLIDTELSYSYDELTPGTSEKDPFSTDQSSPFYNYKKQIAVSLVDSNLNPTSADAGLKKIDVKVFYQEGGSEKNVELATIQTKR